MNIIIPMAGFGKRLRPHTLTTPKPLIPIAGKSIVQRLIENIQIVCEKKINNIAFVINENFGKEIEENLIRIAQMIGSNGKIFYQNEPRGTAHAVLCAKELLEGEIIVAFADTLFKPNFKIDTSQDGTIWVQQVDDPSEFGVVKIENDSIVDIVEKPKEFVSDLAIIGVYYFKNASILHSELQYLIDNDIKDKNEYQLTCALRNMKDKNVVFKTSIVSEWLDCGNKNATVYTNKRYLEFLKDEKLIHDTASIKNSIVVPPVYIGKNTVLENSIIGPHVSLGNDTCIKSSIIQNSIIQNSVKINNANFKNSMIGNFVQIEGSTKDYSIGDYTTLK